MRVDHGTVLAETSNRLGMEGVVHKAPTQSQTRSPTGLGPYFIFACFLAIDVLLPLRIVNAVAACRELLLRRSFGRDLRELLPTLATLDARLLPCDYVLPLPRADLGFFFSTTAGFSPLVGPGSHRLCALVAYCVARKLLLQKTRHQLAS